MNQMVSYIGTIILWIVSIVLLVTGTFTYLFIGLVLLHFIELIFIGYKTGRSFGQSAIKSICMCMLFGIIWWSPLKQMIKEDDAVLKKL